MSHARDPQHVPPRTSDRGGSRRRVGRVRRRLVLSTVLAVGLVGVAGGAATADGGVRTRTSSSDGAMQVTRVHCWFGFWCRPVHRTPPPALPAPSSPTATPTTGTPTTDPTTVPTGTADPTTTPTGTAAPTTAPTGTPSSPATDTPTTAPTAPTATPTSSPSPDPEFPGDGHAHHRAHRDPDEQPVARPRPR